MSPTIKSENMLSTMNEAISNPTLAAVTSVALVLGGVSISGVMDDPESLKNAFLIVQSKIHVGSVMNVDFSYEQ